ncbi:mitochondrial import receptor subunit TOM22 homolog [Babylonia areolata]|uniref:mitochondrial import receptor subunit TOM22 homolog n=1 Tax=Babylonia areolata TaxID=304850 RepID=UPI003FD55BAA
MAGENVMELARPGFQDEEDEDDLDETLAERLWGLTEMFPAPVQKLIETSFNMSFSALKAGYSLGRVALWVAASSSAILVLPVVFESERAQQQQQELQQQRQILLGPSAAMPGGGGQNMLPGMGMMPPGMATAK